MTFCLILSKKSRMSVSRFSRAPKDKHVNELVTRQELLAAQEELRGTDRAISFRKRRTTYLMRNRALSENQGNYLKRFWNQAVAESGDGTISMGRYHIAHRLHNNLGEYLELDGEIEDDDEYDELWDKIHGVTFFTGTACSGKNFHGEEVAAQLGVPVIDTDLNHKWKPNVFKMMHDKPLTEDDRADYFDGIINMTNQFREWGLNPLLIFPAHTREVRQRMRQTFDNDVLHVRNWADFEWLLQRGQSRDHLYIRRACCEQFLRNQVAINQPLSKTEKRRYGDIEICTNEDIPLEQVQYHMRESLNEEWGLTGRQRLVV